jgi:hypothetical protein
MSLHEFIETNHAKLLSMTRQKVAKRSKDPRPDGLEAKHGVHVFLTELCEALVAHEKQVAAEEEGDHASKDEILRRLVGGSIELLELVRAGKVAPGGSTAAALGQSLEEMRVMLVAVAY